MKIAAGEVFAPPFCFDSPNLRGFNRTGIKRTFKQACGRGAQAVKRLRPNEALSALGWRLA
jgi:hypothetical protein